MTAQTPLTRWISAAAVAALFASPVPATAQLPVSTGGSLPNQEAALIEWDLPAEGDAQPGAMMVDLHGTEGGQVWFVTRTIGMADNPDAAPAQRVYRLDIKPGAKHNYAAWYSWQLDPALTGTTGGVRKVKTSKDKRYVFVRTLGTLQRIDTQGCVPTVSGVACPRAAWLDGSDANGFNVTGVSDIAIDEQRNVYTALSKGAPENSYVQRLNSTATENNVTRWLVGGGAGSCQTFGESSPCLSGIDVHPRTRYLVYYSEPVGGEADAGAIAELNTYNNSVRRWPLAELSTKTGDTIAQPRQLHVDHDGLVWVVTGSGHLVSLDPGRNRMSKHRLPEGVINDPWGIAPDNGMIGYTVTGEDLLAGGMKHAVAMLVPDRDYRYVAPFLSTAPRETLTVPAQGGWGDRSSGVQPPTPKKVPARVTPTDDGTFIEALIGTNNDSTLPLGITPDQGSSVGTFFYAVGQTMNPTVNRVGRVRLPRDGHKGKHERDDDDCDDDGRRGHDDDDDDDDGWKNDLDDDDDNDGRKDHMDDDDDNDGIEDEWDSRGHKEKKGRYDDEQDTNGGSHSEQAVTTDANTLLVVGIAKASDPLALISIEIVNAAGQVVATSPIMAGAAVVTYVPFGQANYVTRARNHGATPVNFSTTIITRELWSLVTP